MRNILEKGANILDKVNVMLYTTHKKPNNVILFLQIFVHSEAIKKT